MDGYNEDYIEALIEEYENDRLADAENEAADIADEESWEPVLDSTDEFVEIDDLTEIPFDDDETDSISEEYPTVYSTEGGFSPAYKSSDSLNEIDVAA